MSHAPTASLGVRTGRGMIWLVVQALGSKAIGIVGQLVIAWFLTKRDFGLIGEAFTVTAFAGVLNNTGLKEILIQRQLHYRRLANAAFWLSLALSLVGMLTTAIAAPFAARVYRAPELIPLLLLLAASTPLGTLSTVPFARLHIDLHFRSVAAFNLAANTLTMALNVLFAWLGAGAYSFVFPRLIVNLCQSLVLLYVTRPPISINPHFRLWRHLIGDSGIVIATWVCYLVFTQGDYVILGILHTTEVVGIYYFAFNLSTQAVALFTVNLWSVLMPALTRMNAEPARQLRSFLSATRMLAVLGVPVALLQAAAAWPFIHLFFAAKWHPAVPLLQILSLGMALMMIGSPAGSLLQAQGRFRTMFWMAFWHAILFVVMVFFAGWIGAETAVAVAVSIFFGIYGPMNLYAGIEVAGGTWRDVGWLYVTSFVPSGLAAAAAFGVGALLPGVLAGNAVKLTIVIFVGLALHFVLLRVLFVEVFSEFAGHAASVIGVAPKLAQAPEPVP